MASASIQHPLIPSDSTRRPVSLSTRNISSVLSESLPKRKFSGLIVRYPLLATQASFAFARERVIRSSQIFLKRNLTYSITHRQLRQPKGKDSSPFQAELGFELKQEQLEITIEYLREKLIALKSKATYTSDDSERIGTKKRYPVKLQRSPVNFSPVYLSLNLPCDKLPKTTQLKVALQVAVIKGSHISSPQADKTAVKRGVKLYGVVSENSSVYFHDQFLRLPCWTSDDRVVIRIESEPSVFPTQYALCRDVRPADEEWTVCRADHFKLSASVTSAPLPEFPNHFLLQSSPTKVNLEYVLIYPTGNNLQVREMAVLEQEKPCHDGVCCAFCRMECDEVSNLLRHLEGIHIGVGFEYDESATRLYLWLIPESTVERKPVDGFVEFNPYVVVRNRQTSSFRTAFKIKNPHFAFTDSRERLVLYWASRKYTGRPHKEYYPRFNIQNVLRMYGVPVVTSRQYVQMPGAHICRPDWKNLVDYDCEEDFYEALDDENERRLHRHIDCNTQEKQFMALWNRFIGPQLRILPMHIGDVLTQFVQRHAKDIEAQGSFPVMIAHVGVLRRRKILSAKDIAMLIRVFRSSVLQG